MLNCSIDPSRFPRRWLILLKLVVGWQVLPPSVAHPEPGCEPSLRTFVQAELLCFAGECTAAMWILLTIVPPHNGALQPDAW